MEKETWYFTFGSGQQHSNCFVVIDGTREETMEEMLQLDDDKNYSLSDIERDKYAKILKRL